MYKLILKNIIDRLLSITILILTSPLIIISSVILYCQNDGDVFFYQDRPGKNEKLFRIIKFRTMDNSKDEHGNLLPDMERITKAGKFIRKYSLDELPQLINVVKGDMSLIGPRPLLVKYLEHYSVEQRRRHMVKPGITGWAQVNGRNQLSWNEKFKHDLYYVDNISFWLDIKIMFLTVIKIFKREGINQSGEKTMEAFKGS
jgi:undecaprenyl phosphate N,N'-diacetylbacillosamine 1-phosphate transferase